MELKCFKTEISNNLIKKNHLHSRNSFKMKNSRTNQFLKIFISQYLQGFFRNAYICLLDFCSFLYRIFVAYFQGLFSDNITTINHCFYFTILTSLILFSNNYYFNPCINILQTIYFQYIFLPFLITSFVRSITGSCIPQYLLF